MGNLANSTIDMGRAEGRPEVFLPVRRNARLSAVRRLSRYLKSRLMAETLCRWFDHRLVEDGSYVGEYSSGEGRLCTRCGQTWWKHS